MAATAETTLFPRNRVLTTLMVVNSLLFGLCGLIHWTRSGTVLALIWFVGAVLWYINFLWSKKTAYLQLSEKSVTIRPAMARPQCIIQWSAIGSLQRVSDRKAILELKDGEQVKLSLYALNKEDRIPLLNTIERRIADAAG